MIRTSIRGGSRRLRALACVALAVLPLGAAHRPRKKPKASKGAQAAPVLTIQDPQALAPFFAALRQSGEAQHLTRVLQFGDSHTAADYFSGRLRQRLQARFGDGGPGLLMPAKPWRGYPHEGARILAGGAWAAESLRSKDCDGLVGLAGACALPDPGEAFRVRGTFAEARLHLLGGTGAPVPASGPAEPPPAELPLLQETDLGPAGLLRIYREAFPDAAEREAGWVLPSGARLLGVELLSGKPGVVYDELGLNGAELLDLAKWNPALRGALLAWAKPDLLVLAYGTNDLGRPPEELLDYQKRAQALLADLKRESGAAILVVGPLDRMGLKKRARPGLAAGAATVIDALRAAARDTGCAFWDARAAMGGPGAILAWRKAGLAQKDLVHLNGLGYQRLGDLLAEQLLKNAGGAPKAAAEQ